MKKIALVIFILIGLTSYQYGMSLEPLVSPFQNINFNKEHPTVKGWKVCFRNCNEKPLMAVDFVNNQNELIIFEQNGKLNQSLYNLSIEENDRGYIATYNIRDNQTSSIKSVVFKISNENSLLDMTVDSDDSFDLVFNLKDLLPEENINGFGGLYNGTRLVAINSQKVESLVSLSNIKDQEIEWLGARSRFWTFLINSDHLNSTVIDDVNEENLSFRLKSSSVDAISKYQFRIYFGPVERSQIEKVSLTLNQLMYSALWDWLRLICRAIEILFLWCLSITGNPGLSILLLAVSVKFLLYPLTFIAEKWQSQVNKTQAWIQPKINEINKQYSGEEANTRILNLYRENNISPFFTIKGLFGFLIQVPIFIAVFDVLGESILLAGQSFFFIEDLSKPDQWLALPFAIPFFGSYFNLLPLLMTIITLVSAISYRDQYLTGDLLKDQQLKLYIMAALFFILFFTFPSGMVLYWTCSNLIQLLKSLVIKKSSLA